MQGILEIIYRFERMLCEISGMDALHASSRAAARTAIYANACIIRAYHARPRRAEQRDEIITTIFSHPCDGAGAGDGRVPA